ncbi:MAG: hypothetical protein LQ338_002775 [Usnochroma carphineum]|nr:MAG: hypothetical protein LQ338_002775 [Usnochroma carphineum]
MKPRNDENDVTRKIALTSTNGSVIIGRASKTATKGLVAGPGNAWFDSPIMSRSHGKLFVNSAGTIHIQDSSSTHGTFLGPKRLAPNKPYALSNGDIITFGMTVTSGPVTYHGRSFDVQLSSMSSSEHISPSSTNSKASAHSGFHVPDDDIESLSDDSGPESCRIVKSNPRTFSVPSSGDEEEQTDDEDVIKSSSRRAFRAKRDSSAGFRQTSNQLADVYGEADSLGQRAAIQSPPGSQKHPIALQDGPSVVNDSLDYCSGNEDVDSIDAKHGQQQTPIERDTTAGSMSMTEIPDTYQSPSSDIRETQHGRMRDDGDCHHAAGRYAMKPESEPVEDSPEDANDPRPSSAIEASHPHTDEAPFSHSGSSQGDHSEDDSGEAEDDAAISEPLVERNSVSSTIEVTQDQSQVQPVRTGVLSASRLSGYRTVQKVDGSSPCVNWSRTTEPDYSFPEPHSTTCNTYHPNSMAQAFPSALVRAPSPSDAALARKATLGRAGKDNPFFDGSQSSGLPGLSYHGPAVHNLYSGPRYGVPPSRRFGETRSETLAPVHRPALESLSSQTLDACEAAQASNLDTRRSGSGSREQGPFSRGAELFYSAADTSFPDSQPNSLPPKKCLVRLKVDHKNPEKHTRESRNDMFSPPDPKVDLAKSRKVDISNLVNSQTEKSRSLKRKSDQMSSDEALGSVVRVASQPQSVQDASQCETEPRTQLGNSARTVPASLPQEVAHGLSPPTTDAAVEEPARKKLKASRAKAGTLGGLISGICLGLAGAAAAFIAAIPADVRDEAMREIVKLG